MTTAATVQSIDVPPNLGAAWEASRALEPTPCTEGHPQQREALAALRQIVAEWPQPGPLALRTLPLRDHTFYFEGQRPTGYAKQWLFAFAYAAGPVGFDYIEGHGLGFEMWSRRSWQLAISVMAKEGRLRGAHLAGLSLWQQPLSGADLSEANLSRAYLPHARLEGANLTMANLQHAHLSEARLDGASLTQAELGGANLEGANLCDVNAIHVDLSNAYLRRAEFRRANLAHAWLEAANCTETDFSSANLYDANLDGADLLRTRFGCARLNFASFDGATLEDVYMRRATMWTATFEGATFDGGDLSGAKVSLEALAEAAELNDVKGVNR